METETNGSVGYRKKISKVLEKKLIVHSDFVLTVSDSICDWYKTTYNLENIAVLKNIPAKKDYGERKELKKILEITEEKLLFIYQGYLTKSRGVLEILEAFESLDSSKHILFMGFGPLVDKIIARSNKCSNIHFIKGVSPKEVLSYTAGADIGIHIILNTCLNHYYCLPNKVFEYASAGIPFIASNFPDLRSEFEKHNISWFGEPSAQGLVKVIGAITLDDFNEKKKNSMEKRNFWSWEIQEHFLQEVYLKLLETNSNNCD
ncbi:MAG: glycosyltransferase [Cyclobacteriaceae bacterium]|nr:glycosyltransferase [Cyclobacteriaceae bacterium]